MNEKPFTCMHRAKRVLKMSRAVNIGKQIKEIAFDSAILISAFTIAIVSLAMSWKMRCAFSSVLLNILDTMMKNKAILRVALDVRWKKRR